MANSIYRQSSISIICNCLPDPSGFHADLTEANLHATTERMDVDPFGRSVVQPVTSIHPTPSLGLSQKNPVCRSVAAARETAGVHKRFQQQGSVALEGLPIMGELASTTGKDLARQSHHLNPGKDQEATVVDGIHWTNN